MADPPSGEPVIDSTSPWVATFQPQECPVEGGERLIVTFSRTLPDDPIVIILQGANFTHKLQPERINNNIISAILPAHTTPEVVRFAAYWLPSSCEAPTYQAVLLMEDQILYTDHTHYILAEQLIHSVNDGTQASLFYSMLPPLATMDIARLYEFDIKLRDAVEEVELPDEWNMVNPGHTHQDTLLHFASKNSLPNLFTLLLTLPGGKSAIQVPNEEGKLPIQLAKESGCHEITRIIESLERQNSLVSIENSTPLSSLSLSEGKTLSSPQLLMMQEIDGDWIYKQKSQKKNINGLNALPPPALPRRAGSSPVSSSQRPNSIAVMEALTVRESSPTSMCWLCMKEPCRRKSWSRVVGGGRTRSVDTGMNELDRITDQIMAHEKLQELRNTHFTSKGEWLDRWSFSCPTLNDDMDSVSNDLIHSTLTSPGLLDGPTFLSDFATAAPFNTNETDQSDAIPHSSLLTSGNHGNEEIWSVSPSVTVPQVCVEDENSEKVCMEMGLARDKDDTLKAKDFPSLPPEASSSEEEEEEELQMVEEEEENKKQSQMGGTPLASKSAPALRSMDTTKEESPELPEEQTTPSKMSKSYSYSISTSSSSEHTPKRNDAASGTTLGLPECEEEEEDEYSGDEMRTKSAIFPSTESLKSPSPIHRSSTPSSTPPTRPKGHHKSLSVSNVIFNPDNGEEGKSVQKDEEMGRDLLKADESRSRGSSFLSSSSKMESSDSEDDSEDEDFDPPVVEEAILTGHKKIVPRDEEFETSDEDLLDGEVPLKSRRGRRISLVKVTNVDDYSESEEETGHYQPLPRSSTVENELSQTTRTQQLPGAATGSHPLEGRHHSSSPPSVKRNDITLSDIDVSVDSLNGSMSGEFSRQDVRSKSSPLRRGSQPVEPFSFKSPPPTKTPGKQSVSDPKQTIKNLQDILRMENDEYPVFVSGSMSDNSDNESIVKRAKKAKTLPTNSPNSHKSSIPSDSTKLREHSKVSRNESSASDSKVLLSSSGNEAEISSLDFVKPQDGQMSPRIKQVSSQGDVSSMQSPQSPLFFSKRSPSRTSEDRSGESLLTSPKGLEKRVSRSADNLLAEEESEEKNENQSPAKQKKKEDGSVRLLRFEPLPEDRCTDDETNTGTVISRGRKDIKTYYGFEVKEPVKKGSSSGFKLFRRDSKKDKKPKKFESSNSMENGNEPKDKARQSQPLDVRKARSQTVHGDFNIQVPVPSMLDMPEMKTVKKPHSKPPPLQRESISPVKEESSSSPVPPLSPSEFGEAESNSSLSIKFEDYPELFQLEEANASWYLTIDRRLRKQMNKHEKGRQGVMYDWITTEKHICKAFLILKHFFYERLKKGLRLSEDTLSQLFPSLDELLDISQQFCQRLSERQKNSGAVIHDISDILLDEFTGAKGERMRCAYTHFICLHPSAVELYRDLEKKKQKFSEMMNILYQNKVCERKKLPDFYLMITQRVAKYVEMMKKLVKETEALKLEHLKRVKTSNMALQSLVESIDRGVYEYNSRKELEDIQSRLEIHIPKAPKSGKLRRIKSLDFTAQNRFLLKRGEAMWQGHGKQIAVQIILVTDFLALLTEKDQKYHLATLQDLQPPVIKLIDLHVRVNAAVKSGVQLLLLEQGVVPEMFRLEFLSKKLAKEWEEAFNEAVDYCKKNQLKCEHFGTETVLSGDETREDEEEKEEGFDGEPDPDLSPNSYRRALINLALEQANRLLAGPTPSASFGGSMMTIEEASSSPRPVIRGKPNRATTFRGSSVDESKRKQIKKTVERGKSFLDKKQSLEEFADREKHVLLECISRLKESLENVLEENDKKDELIAKLKKDFEELREEQKDSPADSISPIMPRSQRVPSFNRNRPHSLHSDMFEAPNDSEIVRSYPQQQ